MKKFVFIGVHSWFALSSAATPLDDHVAAFKTAPAQTEAAVSSILQAGLSESRSALAFTAVKPWLDAQPSPSPAVLWQATQAAERGGDWPAAVNLYRKLLKNPSLDPQIAAVATPATYRLLINHLGDIDAAYLLMREDGDRLRAFGRVRQFDAWFITQARNRGDLAALCNRLVAMIGADPANPAAWSADLEWTCGQLESFSMVDDATLEAARKLSAAANLPAPYRARLNWVLEIVPFTRQATELFRANKPIPDALFDQPLQAAAALVAALPREGSILAARGWMNLREGHTPNLYKYTSPRREAKTAPIIKALASLPARQAQAVLAAPGCPQGRPVISLFYAEKSYATPEMMTLVRSLPAVFNSLASPDTALFGAGLTVEEAKVLSPLLARNPSPHAALVRAYAVAGTNTVAAVVPVMMKSEMWRFNSAKAAIDAAWNSGCKREKADHNALCRQYENLGARYDQVRKQMAKEAGAQDRAAAAKTLMDDLMAASPTLPDALSLWSQLFRQAPAEEAVALLKTLLGNLEGDREFLVRQAVAAIPVVGGRAIYTGPAWDGFMQNGRQNASYKTAMAPLIPDLQRILTTELQTGHIPEYWFAIWLHAADPKDAAAQTFMKTMAASPAYAKLGPAYQSAAADSMHFGPLALTPAMAAVDAATVSRELLALPREAPPAAVEAALKTVVARAAAAPAVVPVIGLRPVAALPQWSAQTRQLVLSLLNENAPLGAAARAQGDELLVSRVLKELREKGEWSAAEPVAAGLWHASSDLNYHPNAAELSMFAETAFTEGHPSLAMTFARGGLKSQAGRAMAAQAGNTTYATIVGRLRQVAGKAAAAIGAAEIPVDETDPAYPIYKSHAEFVQDNADSAWALYLAHADQLQPLLRKLTLEYAFWLLRRNVEADRGTQAEELVKELTIWSREAPGTFNPEQEARLKIAYATLAFRKGALPTARAWFRKVADAAEYNGSEMQLEAALGSVQVDRVSKNFSAALTELDKLMRLRQPEFRLRVHYARAEVLMDQENYAEALGEVETVLRQQPKHADAMILRGRIHFQMRKLVEASEIELGPSQEDTRIVPGESLKINLRDPTLGVSGLGADIEVEIRAKSGDVEKVLLHPLGDSKDKFRAELPTALGRPTPGDKTLQVLGDDEIRFGYSKEFRAKMADLPPDPETVIGVASDAYLDLTAGAFPPRAGERQLDIEELGLSTAQAALGTRSVRPGNQIYLRLTDLDQSKTADIDRVTVSLQASSGDEIRRLELTETSPFSGEFQAVVRTAGAQALAFASDSAPGRDPNMAISMKDYPGWQSGVGDKEKVRTFGIDLNDNVALGRMTLDTGGVGQALTHFVLQTSMNGKDWITRARHPAEPAPWEGRPRVASFPTYNGGMAVSNPKGRDLPADWREIMEVTSARASIRFLSANVPNLSARDIPLVDTGHPGYSALIQFRALFYQPAAAIRRFRLSGLPLTDDKGVIRTIFLIDGKPADAASDDPFVIEREFAPGLHEIEVWCHDGRADFLKRKPELLCDVPGKPDLEPCPDAMFDPATFPAALRATLPRQATLTRTAGEGLEVVFGDPTQARMVRLAIVGYESVAASIRKVTLADRAGKSLVPVAQDYLELRENQQLEVLPGDRITARYQDPKSATPRRDRQERQLAVAFNNGSISASFLNYETTPDGQRVLVLEPVRRFRFSDPIAIVIDDPDLDATAERDTADFTVTSSSGEKATLKAVETEEHSGRFIGRVFPVEGEPTRPAELRMEKGGELTAIYRDMENLDPGIPSDRAVTIGHAQYAPATLEAFTQTSKTLPAGRGDSPSRTVGKGSAATAGPEVILPRRTLEYTHVGADKLAAAPLDALIGSALRFDVVVPHLALASSSILHAYVQTEAARAAAGAVGKPFDVTVPGTLKIPGTLNAPAVDPPAGYLMARKPAPPTPAPPLEEGRFSFAVPLILGDPPIRSYATKDAEELPASAFPEGLAVKAGDVVHVAFPWQDGEGGVQWVSARFTVGSHAILDVLQDGYTEILERAYVGEKIHLRLLAPGLDLGPERDRAEVVLQSGQTPATRFQMRETEPHSGVFKGVFALSYATGPTPAQLPPVELNGFPVRYGDEVAIAHGDQAFKVVVNKGADGSVEPFSKRFTDNQMAVRTSFTLAECYFELAKKHREMEEESLARREIGQARKLLAETLATHHDEDLKAHAEYLLANLAQEFADLAKNEESRLPMYQDALARFTRLPLDFPKSEFAPKAQFKVGLVYEKLNQFDNAIEEYIKLAYKYPDDELIPATIMRLGGYFQKKGLALKKQADELRDRGDEKSKAEVLRLDQLSYPEFLNAAMVYAKLQERFPQDKLAGLAALAAAQNFMRASQYERAIASFQRAIDNEEYDGPEIRAQAIYWCGLSHERLAGVLAEDNYRARGAAMRSAYELYRRVTFDFPDGNWAKYARGRLADPAFARIIAEEKTERERMIEGLKEEKKKL